MVAAHRLVEEQVVGGDLASVVGVVIVCLDQRGGAGEVDGVHVVVGKLELNEARVAAVKVEGKEVVVVGIHLHERGGGTQVEVGNEVVVTVEGGQLGVSGEVVALAQVEQVVVVAQERIEVGVAAHLEVLVVVEVTQLVAAHPQRLERGA